MAGDIQKPITLEGKKRLLGWGLVGVMVFLFAGLAMAYLVYSRLETTLQEMQIAYAAEKGKTKELGRQVEGLLKSMERARAQEQAYMKTRQASQQEKMKMKEEALSLKTSIKQMQGAYAIEQANTLKMRQTAKNLLNVMEQAQVQLKTLDRIHKAAVKEKHRLASESMRLKTTVKQLQTAYASEQAKTNSLTHQVDQLDKSVERSQDRVHSLEQAEKGRRMVRDIEREWKEKAENWGKDISKVVNQMFY